MPTKASVKKPAVKSRQQVGGSGASVVRKGGAADSKALLDAMRAYVRVKGSQLMSDPNITSVGIGHKLVAGEQKPQLAIQFTVAEKAVP